jgi:hypothetical protein
LVATVLIPLSVLVPVLPDLAQAQYSAPSSTPDSSEELANACLQGRSDAEHNVSGVWFFAGCMGAVGILIAYLVEPTPPAAQMLGKSPQYVAMYTDCYKSAGKSAQGKKAITGCLVMTAAEVALYVIVWVLILGALSTEENSGESWG